MDGSLNRRGFGVSDAQRYGDAMFWVVSCALNHYCYDMWNKRLKATNDK